MKRKLAILCLTAALAAGSLVSGCGMKDQTGRHNGSSTTTSASAEAEKEPILFTPVDRNQSDFMPIDWMGDCEGLVTACDYKSLDTSDPRYAEDYSDDSGIAGIIQMLEEKTTYADDLAEKVEKEYNDMVAAEQTAAESQGKDFATYLQDNYQLSEEEYQTQRREAIERDLRQNALAVWLVENMDITVKADTVKDYAELMLNYADENSDDSSSSEEAAPKQTVEEYLGSLKDDGSLDYFYFLCASEDALKQIREEVK